MAIKKAYQSIVSLLEANRDELVSEVIDNVIELASAKTGGGGGKATAFYRNEAGEVVAIRCFYHQTWMDPRVVEFGKKASSSTGLNSMCKEGVSKWTKAQRDYKKGKEELLTKVGNGELEADQVKEAVAQLDEARQEIIPLDGDYTGFATLDECLADSGEA